MVGLLECPLKAVTGLPCPVCGMTRAFVHLAQGEITTAFYYHPLFWVIILLVVLYGISLKKPTIAKILTNKYWWIGIAVLFLGVYFYRMVHLFPNQVPLDFNSNAFLSKIWKIFAP
ncbi:DUF2752 domain-containing protein [Enterococcus dispar]|jgi:hypothetical protein|uniref:DUF2752 domain-containing protein n=1 Tax=Enterococcus dispar ATCC 51266 TaxID=1139219 RepID=S1N7I0_9ENTE|nr:DUF2752 domain-containing protein [Enterococcus dispar]EOT42567.1 hypothetical protein OMK_00927 [Enterococcus dispar ATCC 51266]EOW84982.1 hypothetical protein I569_00272 [Enterococcus dispar ATCC 51266]MCU7356110.1 DUF2752 domain-containing protein [Enterococcus dispar]